MTGWVLAALLLGTPLVDAVRQHDAAAVRALLTGGADVNAPEADGATALHWAVYDDDAEMVGVLLAAGAKAGASNDLAITPLHLAAANGNAAIVQRLLERGANPNAASETGVTPIMEAARSGSAAAVTALAARGADVNAREAGRGQTALMWAAARGHAAAVRALLDAHADVGARTKVRPLTAMLDRGPSRTVKTSMQDARRIDAGGSTALHFAAQNGDVESAAALLAKGAAVNDTAANGESALTLACFSGHGEVARLLIEKGAAPNAAGAGHTALHAAVLRGDLATVRALLAHGADPNARLTGGSPVRRFGSQWALPRTLMGATPLLVAAIYLESDIVAALIAAGADPRLGLPDGTTPLLAAAGLDVQAETRPSDLERWDVVDSDTPVVPRDETQVVDVVTRLVDAGADVNQANDEGDTALHAAASLGQASVIERLANRGAALSVENKAGQTPLALTLPRAAQPGRGGGFPGWKAAEDRLRRLGATR